MNPPSNSRPKSGIVVTLENYTFNVAKQLAATDRKLLVLDYKRACLQYHRYFLTRQIDKPERNRMIAMVRWDFKRKLAALNRETITL